MGKELDLGPLEVYIRQKKRAKWLGLNPRDPTQELSVVGRLISVHVNAKNQLWAVIESDGGKQISIIFVGVEFLE